MQKDMNTEKLNFYGVGPRMARILLPWLAVSLALTFIYRDFFMISTGRTNLINIAGITFLGTGFVLYFSTLPRLLKGLKETKLITTGAYAITCNPLYSAVIVFILPGTALVLNSWIMLTVPFVGYVIFKLYIKQEYDELEKFFGEEYREYRASTPELFPLQVHKWFIRRK